MTGRTRNSGFSIIEVLTALAILMIGLMGIISLQVAAIHWLGQAKHRTAAMQIAVDALEMLKTSPVHVSNPMEAGDPAVILNDAKGAPLVDVNDVALLNDKVIADGVLTWHVLAPASSSGQLEPTGTWRPDFPYVVIYGVEWGGAFGSAFVSSAGATGNAAAQWPEYLPGPLEIYIEVWAGWVELGDKPNTTAIPAPTGNAYYYNLANSGIGQFPAVFPKHKVVVRAIRRMW